MGLLGGSFFYGPYFLIKRWLHRAIEHRAQSAAINQTAEALQEGLDKDFFTNLVKLNFKYIDKYYLQTQVQADKSFYLSAIASCVSLLVILIGISILFFTKRDAHASAHAAGYVAAVAGTLGQFIAAVFFYLYTQTITEMREYHQKLVLTQNLSLALKITEELPPAEQVAVRTRLIDYLAKDINTFLTAKPADTNPRNNSSNIPPAVAPQMELPTGRQTSL